MILLLFLLITKHFILDFVVQSPYMYLNKGEYFHLGGILHAGLHGIGTYFSLIISGFTIEPILLAAFDVCIHYHIDYFKTNINQYYGWVCNTSDKFWLLTGLDQYLHYLTYIGIIYWSIK